MSDILVFISILLFSLTLVVLYLFFKTKKENLVLIDENKSMFSQLNEANLKASTLEVRLDETIKASKEKFEFLENSKQNLKLEFGKLANDILELNKQKIDEQTKQNIEAIIKPFGKEITDFKDQVNKLYFEESKDRNILKHEIDGLKNLSLKISEDANNLSKALKSQVKTQGIWGEMILKNVLEYSGLKEGAEYTSEVALRNDENKSYRPDVIINLPDNRHIIIDAKTSLVGYERYMSATNDEDKLIASKEHLESIKSHIKFLSDKDYPKLLGINSLDFVFMFIPIESALILALESDSSLLKSSQDKKVFLVTPTTLISALKVVENIWQFQKRSKNAEEIAVSATKLYDKFAVFVEVFEKIGNQLNTVQGSYDSAKKTLIDGRGNLVGQFEKLKEMGLTPSKSLPKVTED
ncbi:DNA recombination protein RmuC [Arcobacter sp. FWKO B]|uniref:DNA recombination protein RmuC n=1 Tax=Arcobacter sp. FWKO B TaxID=2593672 RepID=UPI0018A4FEBC|nr:DNA recombination protein RmuC [Arcobacter sp. FWKO B]QOG12757.1 DNA recombination protein RmuC [Arcobacter sp. FWKO B]